MNSEIDCFVSIIIPHFNNNRRLEKTLEALSVQDYPRDKYEVIVVDNGSDRSPEELVKRFSCTLLNETTYLNSPYSARNRGIEKARGDIIVLLDSTCVPYRANWLQEGMAMLINSGADIVSGNIVYEFGSEIPATAELWDSIFGVNAKKAIEKNNYAPGGCLFIRRSLFDTLGMFEEGIRSGGDYALTNKAVRNGYKLIYCENVIVKYPAKKIQTLRKKAIRVGRGQIGIWKGSGKFWLYFSKYFLKSLYPPNPGRIIKAIQYRTELDLNWKTFLKLYFFDWYMRILQTYGNTIQLLSLLRK